jgi:DNA polymerase I-like protein with 3'-5' exonuclease and polymerase domains
MGLFWDDPPSKGRRVKTIRPPIPNTGWKPPKDFPNLSAAKAISFDVETYDPELIDKGPGWARGSGHLVGVSLAVGNGDNEKWYFPIRHEVDAHQNLEPNKVLSWLKTVLNTTNVHKIGANLTYDIGWLRQEGVAVKGPLFDVQFAEALLSEDSKVALDVLAKKYLGLGKETSHLYEWCAKYYGGAVGDKQRANIYRAPPSLVGHYAEADADLPLQLAPILWQELNKRKLLDVMTLESELIPLMIDMRFAGVSVDIDRAEKARINLLREADLVGEKIKSIVGFEVNVNASDSLAKAYDVLGLKYPLTDKKNPSFTGLVLKGTDHPVASLIIERRKLLKTVGTFIDGYILGSHVNGKVYGQFHQLRGGGGGTRSGRFASSNPNLQNVSSRDKVIAPLIRGMFVPHRGDKSWFSADYSQIEYRMLLHICAGTGADEIRARFNANPDIDFHNMCQQMIAEKTKIKLDRKPVKNISFGLVYGMSKKTLAESLGLRQDKANTLFDAYHAALPFVSETMDYYKKYSEEYGEVSTVLGRKSYFDFWVPAKWSNDAVGLRHDEALRTYGPNIKRAFSHKAINRICQGSSADQMKMAMLKMYKAGVFRVLGPPVSTIHDEINISRPHGTLADEAIREVVHIMETAITLRVPVKVEAEEGDTWGLLKSIEV